MLDRLKEIEVTGLRALETVRDQAGLEAWRVANIGRSSPLMTVFGELGRLSKEERPAVGQAANQVKVRLEAALAERAEAVKAAALARSLEGEQLDVTLPGRAVHTGRLHPSTQQLRLVL
ncbi:MAG TPA: phenylalanine--tRNA ligase subunit alpha, partial [Anaerolineales bacterium]